jgi:hypothetical protein
VLAAGPAGPAAGSYICVCFNSLTGFVRMRVEIESQRVIHVVHHSGIPTDRRGLGSY